MVIADFTLTVDFFLGHQLHAPVNPFSDAFFFPSTGEIDAMLSLACEIFSP